EPSARSTLALLLRKRGHRVLEADGVASATTRLAEEMFDLVVTDLRMPDGDGLDVLRTAKAHAPATEVILLTAYAEWKSAKEAIPKAVHHASARAARPFVAVNCGAVPETLLESELFGYMRGAFTGAAVSKLGLFEEADGGTLFLDEIAEMPAALQVKLLRAL